MKISAAILPLALALMSTACTSSSPSQAETETAPPMEKASYVQDIHSYSRPNEAVVKHLNLNLEVNFASQTLSGTAQWDIARADKAEQIIFDTYDLSIDAVTVDGAEASYELSSFDEHMGRPLKIHLPKGAQQVSIRYRTGDSARALQFLEPQQTAGKKQPFLFTQSQAILARSWVPTQDSPGIRFTYKAEVKVPKDMLALMSATNPQERQENGHYHFTMEQPIPSYLLALSVGDIRFDSIGPRTGVYAEPSVLQAAADEFANLEEMVVAAEKLYGPYAWERYDLIVLPPSFPFGGMENPRLTFATPTILAGDRSLVSLVAHELAHSWSGNLVTNATWSDFWLNEGFTVYFEQRIMEELYGREYSEMLAGLTRASLQKAATAMLAENPDDTRLKLDLAGRNPDDGVTAIPYDKGYFFLRLLEETVGRERFDRFLRQYFDTHKFSVMTTERFVEILKTELLSPGEVATVGVQEWIYETGLPENLPEVHSARFALVDRALSTFLKQDKLPEDAVTEGWTTHEWLHFINSLPAKVSPQQLQALDKAYGLSQTGNSEIAAAWFQPTLRQNYEAVYPRVEEFLIEVGRRKFLTPTYAAMLESDKRSMAESIYKKARPNYHAVSRETLDELLDWHRQAH